ncbi:MAG: GGDEF domain-containing protein [Deltaproteobacteria bacterium]|nr:GGDEF domain-containing protein [Candidatus Zymogenaceae bacterium]
MYSPTALFSINASLICVAFSALFFILYLSIDRRAQFLGYCLVTLALAIHQAAIVLRVLFENNHEQYLFWIKVAYIVAVLIGGALTAVSNMLTGRTVRSRLLLLFTVTVVLVVLLVFTPLFGDVTETGQDGYTFTPGLTVYIVGLFLVVLLCVVVARLLYPFFLGERNPRAKSYVIVAVAAGFLMLSLIMDIAVDFGIVTPLRCAYSAPGAIIWVVVGAVGILYQYYRMVAPGKRVLVHLRESRDTLAADKMAISDNLTNLFTRDFFDENIEAEVLDSIQQNRSLSLMMIELDDFKNVKKVLGNELSDNLISEIAAVIKRHLKGSDIPARYEMEMFAILLPNTSTPGAEEVAERIRHIVEEMEFLSPGNPDVRVTVSMGVATLRGSDVPADLMKRCVDSLKSSIKHGGNRVSVAT